jgi:hypothetical protein
MIVSMIVYKYKKATEQVAFYSLFIILSRPDPFYFQYSSSLKKKSSLLG